MDLKSKKSPLKVFVLAVILLIMADWYYQGWGVATFFICISMGLIIDQMQRINNPTYGINDVTKYRNNKVLKLVGLLFTVNSPLIIIYFNDMNSHWEFPLFILLLGVGAILNWTADSRYPYAKKSNM